MQSLQDANDATVVAKMRSDNIFCNKKRPQPNGCERFNIYADFVFRSNNRRTRRLVRALQINWEKQGLARRVIHAVIIRYRKGLAGFVEGETF